MAGDLNQSPATYLTYREAKVFQDIGMWTDGARRSPAAASPSGWIRSSVTDGTLPLLGVRPALGRLFTAEDDAPGSAETVILSHEFWQRVFRATPTPSASRWSSTARRRR